MKVPAGTALLKHWMCFQDHHPFQKCLTKQELAKYVFEIVGISHFANKNVTLKRKLHCILIIDDAEQPARSLPVAYF